MTPTERPEALESKPGQDRPQNLLNDANLTKPESTNNFRCMNQASILPESFGNVVLFDGAKASDSRKLNDPQTFFAGDGPSNKILPGNDLFSIADQNHDKSIDWNELCFFEAAGKDARLSKPEFNDYLRRVAPPIGLVPPVPPIGTPPHDGPDRPVPPIGKPPHDGPDRPVPPIGKPPHDGPDRPVPPIGKPPHDGPDRPVRPIDRPSDAAGELAELLAQNDPARRGKVIADTIGDRAYGKNGHSDKIIPDGVTGFGQWGTIYPERGRTADRNAKIQVADSAVYFHRKDGGWVLAQSPDQAKWWEGNYSSDFKGDRHIHGDGKLLSDGSFQFSSPPPGMNDHFGPGSLKFDPKLYDGVFTTMSVKSNSPDSGLVMRIGGDYWRPGIVKNRPGQTERNLANPTSGGSNWTRITSDWQKLYYTSLDRDTLLNDPPPGLR